MLSSGPGTYYDGIAAARRTATVELDKSALVIRGGDGEILERWPYEELDERAAPAGTLRLGRLGNRVSSRLDIRDCALAAAIKGLTGAVDKRRQADRRTHVRVIGWSIVAVISLVTMAIFGVPVLADRLAPLIPPALERRLGQAVEPQVRAMLETSGSAKPFECGGTTGEKVGRTALDKLVGRLEGAAALPVPLRVLTVRRKEANAFALPGGIIYLFEGLIQKVENADELGAVIAHEIGHVAHRDGVRSVLQSAGLSFVFGMVLGDFFGGGAVIVAARAVLSSAYSREVEAAADSFGVDLMNRIGRDGRALGTILQRIAGSIEPVALLAAHPEMKARVAAIDLRGALASSTPLVSAPEWTALKQICAGR